MEDLPKAVLVHSLLPLLDNKSVHALFSTCKAFLPVVLERQRVRLHIRLQPENATSSAIGLAWACRHARGTVHLSLHGQQTHAEQLMDAAVQRMDGPLLNVTHLTWEGTQISAPVPPWLSSACPNLSAIKLDSTCTWYSLPAPRPLCPSVSHLDLQFNWHDGTLPQHCTALQAALLSLPSLVHITWRHCPALLTVVSLVPPVTAWQLTSMHLELGSATAAMSTMMLGPQSSMPRFLSHFPALVTLNLGRYSVTDADLAALLHHRPLRQLYCAGTRIQQNYAQHRSSSFQWEVFSTMESVRVQQLARLPLHRIQSVELRGGVWAKVVAYSVFLSNDLEENTTVAGHLAGQGGLRWVVTSSDQQACSREELTARITIYMPAGSLPGSVQGLVDMWPVIVGRLPEAGQIHLTLHRAVGLSGEQWEGMAAQLAAGCAEDVSLLVTCINCQFEFNPQPALAAGLAPRSVTLQLQDI